MWSDAPNQVETRGAAREDFDLQKAAESLANSDVSLPGGDGSEEEARADGGSMEGGCGCGGSGGSCGCGGNCQCGRHDDKGHGRFASDGGVAHSASATAGARDSDTGAQKSKTERAYELLHEEAKRVYDVGESHYLSWGWEVYAYTWTKSISAGVFLLPSLLILAGVLDADPTLVGVSAIASTVFLGATGVLLVVDLEQPSRFHWVLLRPNWTSWLVKGAYIITGFGAYLGLVVLCWLLGFGNVVTNPVVLLVGAALATATAVYTAFLFSQSKGRDLWQSPAMPAHMFAQAVVAGGAATALLGIAGFDALVGPSRLALAAGLVGHLALVGSEIFTPHQTEDAEEAAARITRGRFSRAFWVGGVLVGIALPLVVLAASGAPVAVAAAGVLALAGLLAYEYCWITAPQTISLA